MIYFVDEVGPSPLAQNVAFRDLPLRDVGQHPLFLIFWDYKYLLHIWSTNFFYLDTGNQYAAHFRSYFFLKD